MQFIAMGEVGCGWVAAYLYLHPFASPRGGLRPPLGSARSAPFSDVKWSAQALTNYRLSLFFNLSFIANKGGTKNKKSIFFNFCQIFAFFEDFLRFHNVIRSFHLKNFSKFWEKIKKNLVQNFFQPYIKNYSKIDQEKFNL